MTKELVWYSETAQVDPSLLKALQMILQRWLLFEHGTKLVELKPTSIIYAARCDLLAKDKNDSKIPYAFHKQHVGKAKNVRQLLELALKDRKRGVKSREYNTRLIYRNEELLQRALKIESEKNH
jgi:hypothetical protein